MSKNIILITVDCLRADHLGCMGYKNITPNIDKLAEEGILFKNAIANASYTDHSIPSFFTSTLPPVKERLLNITQVLKGNNYSTGAFNPNPQGVSNIRGDFDKYDLIFTYGQKTRYISVILKQFIGAALSKISKDPNLSVNILSFLFSKKQFFTVPPAEQVNEKAIHWINEQNKPFFLWLHYLDTHEPYAPPNYRDLKELQKILIKFDLYKEKLTNKEIEKIIDLYDENIKYVDTEIGKFVEKLKEMKIYNNSIIIISADHGDAFNEHGFYSHIEGTVYDELLRVPLIIHGVKKEVVEDRQVQLIDLAPTICELLDIPIPLSFEGDSLFDPKEKIVVSNTNYATSYRTNDYKLIINKFGKSNVSDKFVRFIVNLPANKKKRKKEEFYNLKNDPEEKINIYDKNKDIAKKIHSEAIENVKKKLDLRLEQEKIRAKIDRLKEKLDPQPIKESIDKNE